MSNNLVASTRRAGEHRRSINPPDRVAHAVRNVLSPSTRNSGGIKRRTLDLKTAATPEQDISTSKARINFKGTVSKHRRHVIGERSPVPLRATAHSMIPKNVRLRGIRGATCWSRRSQRTVTCRSRWPDSRDHSVMRAERSCSTDVAQNGIQRSRGMSTKRVTERAHCHISVEVAASIDLHATSNFDKHRPVGFKDIVNSRTREGGSARKVPDKAMER